MKVVVGTYFNQPYPHHHHNFRQWFLTSMGAGLFVGLFLTIFQPFGSDDWHGPNKPFVLAGFGVVTFLCMLIFGGLPRMFKDWYDEKNWTVGREIFWNLLLILPITLGNLFYGQFFFGWHFDVGMLLSSLAMTASIGVIPATIITLLKHTQLVKKYSTEGLEVLPNSPLASTSALTLVAENEKDTFVLAPHELLYIESADNYSEVVYWRQNKLQKTLLRSSLARITEQIESPLIVRCHRSFIVNLQQVASISGNAQGYKLQLKNTPVAVPVARRYGDLVVHYFKK